MRKIAFTLIGLLVATPAIAAGNGKVTAYYTAATGCVYFQTNGTVPFYAISPQNAGFASQNNAAQTAYITQQVLLVSGGGDDPYCGWTSAGDLALGNPVWQ